MRMFRLGMTTPEVAGVGVVSAFTAPYSQPVATKPEPLNLT